MSEVSVDSLGLGPLGRFDHADVEAWAVSGRAGRVIEDDLRAFLKAQFLCAAIGSSLGSDVARGLAGEELAAALALAAHPSKDWEEHGAKRAALCSHASLTSSTNLVAVMVVAALRHDEQRLARTVTGDRRRLGSPSPTVELAFRRREVAGPR